MRYPTHIESRTIDTVENFAVAIGSILGDHPLANPWNLIVHGEGATVSVSYRARNQNMPALLRVLDEDHENTQRLFDVSFNYEPGIVKANQVVINAFDRRSVRNTYGRPNRKRCLKPIDRISMASEPERFEYVWNETVRRVAIDTVIPNLGKITLP